jgi:hypothetical protein
VATNRLLPQGSKQKAMITVAANHHFSMRNDRLARGDIHVAPM